MTITTVEPAPAPTPWPASVAAGTATGVGSLPGTDGPTAQARVFDLLPGLPHLVELPDRGPGADMVGRGATLLTELPVDLQPSGWRFVERPGLDLRRARDLLARDLDVLAETGDGWAGPIKLQACGPWTLAATVELMRGDKALQDRGAVADIAASLADGLADHVAAVRRALPLATVIVQLDEPALPAVLLGRVPTASGFSVLRVPDGPEAQEVLTTVLSAVPYAGIHCCAESPPVALMRAAGARWVGVDATLLSARDDDAIGEAVEAGIGIVVGTDTAAAVSSLRSRLGLAGSWRAAAVLSPRCGLAGSADPWGTYARVVEGARRLAEDDA